jgi:hypothetical protein
MNNDFSAWQRGDRMMVQMLGDDRWLEAIYLGPAKDAVVRDDRQMIAVDDGEAWRLMMAPTIQTIKPMEKA